MQAGSVVLASIQRLPSVLAGITATASDTTPIPALRLRAFLGGRVYLAPISSQFALDIFGVAPEQATQAVSDWDATWTDPLPIRPGDTLVVTSTGVTHRYPIHGVQPYPGKHVLLLVGVELATP